MLDAARAIRGAARIVRLPAPADLAGAIEQGRSPA